MCRTPDLRNFFFIVLVFIMIKSTNCNIYSYSNESCQKKRPYSKNTIAHKCKDKKNDVFLALWYNYSWLNLLAYIMKIEFFTVSLASCSLSNFLYYLFIFFFWFRMFFSLKNCFPCKKYFSAYFSLSRSGTPCINKVQIALFLLSVPFHRKFSTPSSPSELRYIDVCVIFIYSTARNIILIII